LRLLLLPTFRWSLGVDDYALAFETAISGCACRVDRRESDWLFDLGRGGRLTVGCHWRLVSADRITLTDEDDEQLFGLPEPVNAEAAANELIAKATVSQAVIDRVTADLHLQFSNGLRLDLINNSSGYEAWQASFDYDGYALCLVALGGGGLAGWSHAGPSAGPDSSSPAGT